MNFNQKLKNILNKNNSNLVIGLDSDTNKIPSFFLKYKNPIAEFNKKIIELTAGIVSGYKLNIAFYEYLEETGFEALRQTLNSIPDDLIKICDAKRGDIDNTAEMYAALYFDKLNFDSITLSPYMGKESLMPFLKRKNKLAFVLALTSNPGASEFQKLKINGRYLYEEVIDKSLSSGGEGQIGFVFGANHTAEIGNFTSKHPEIPLLVPGIGAQKNDLNDLKKSLHSKQFLINSSRNIIYSADKNCSEKEFTNNVFTAAVSLNNDINESF